MAVTTKIYDTKIDHLFDGPTALRAYMNTKVAETVMVARVEAPTKSHALQRSISSTYHGGGRWSVSASAPHAKFVHNGTKSHLIKGRRRSMLRFFWEKVGAVVYLRQVNHPGTKANPFLTRAMHKVWDSV
jgi:hypothetical protein